jgi:hypothetical protein
MRLALVIISVVIGLAGAAGGCATRGAARAQAPDQGATSLSSGAAGGYPPAVLTGDGVLNCTIDSRTNGHQRLEMVTGGGLEFDAVVSPIVDGTVMTSGPDKGGEYRFTSHLAGPAKGKLPGAGEVEIDELETKVAVQMNRYRQPGGRGTQLTFSTADMSRRGIYVEFVGKAHSARGERYAFRVNLGAPVEGSGAVMPGNDNTVAPMASKAVYIRAPISTVLITTTLQPIH